MALALINISRATGCSASNEEPVDIHAAQELSGRIPLHLKPRNVGELNDYYPAAPLFPRIQRAVGLVGGFWIHISDKAWILG